MLCVSLFIPGASVPWCLFAGWEVWGCGQCSRRQSHSSRRCLSWDGSGKLWGSLILSSCILIIIIIQLTPRPEILSFLAYVCMKNKMRAEEVKCWTSVLLVNVGQRGKRGHCYMYFNLMNTLRWQAWQPSRGWSGMVLTPSRMCYEWLAPPKMRVRDSQVVAVAVVGCVAPAGREGRHVTLCSEGTRLYRLWLMMSSLIYLASWKVSWFG